MKEPIKQYKPAEKLELPSIKKEFPKVFKKVHCPSCAEVVDVENITLEKSLAKCSDCQVIFSIEEEVKSLEVKKEMKQEIFRPEGIDLFYYKDDLEIVMQQQVHWVDGMAAILLPFFSFLSFLGYFDKNVSIVFPILLTTLSLFFFYRVLQYYYKYKTYIDVNQEFLNIRHRPNNYRKDKSFDVADIDQVYLNTHGDGYFRVNLIVNGTKGQQHIKILTVNSISKAKYLEQELEKYLGIEDRKIPESNV